MAFLTGGANTLAAGGYDVDNSCRFNDGDSPHMAKNQGTPSSTRIYTFSFWFKLGASVADQTMFSYGADSDSQYSDTFIEATGDGSQFRTVIDNNNDYNLITNRVFRDPSAWYHAVVAVDTTQGTAANRVKIFINGVQETSLSVANYPTQNFDVPSIASGKEIGIGNRMNGNSRYFDGYLSEVVFCDGQVYGPTDFGEFDSASPTIWKPKDVSGLTFGTNGFYLDFEDSSNLGNDANGGTDLTETNLAADDQCLDSPTNNFCTLNPLDVVPSSITFAHGNTQAFWASTAAWRSTFGTMAPSSGKWYYEVIGGNSSGHLHAAIVSPEYAALLGATLEISTTNSQPSYTLYGANGRIYYSNTSGAGNNTDELSAAYVHTDYIGVYFDLDNNKLYYAKNGTVINSGTGFDIEAGFAYMPGFSLYNNTAAGTGVNFGNGNFLGTAISGTTYNDANGYGIFKYDPSAGTFDGGSKEFLALCTKNLAEFG